MSARLVTPDRSVSQRVERPASGEVVALSPATIDDRTLVLGVGAGRPAAIAAFFDRFHPLVRRMLARTLGNTRDVEDLVQDAFLTLVRRVPELRDPSALRSFVVGVAVRTAKNELRRRALRRFVGLGEVEETSVVAPHDAEAAERVRHVYAVLDRLDADLRISFVLRHVEGMELEEAARACGCSLATFKRRLSRAHAKFETIASRDPVLEGLLGRASATKEEA